jgi:hypothetical protein
VGASGREKGGERLLESVCREKEQEQAVLPFLALGVSGSSEAIRKFKDRGALFDILSAETCPWRAPDHIVGGEPRIILLFQEAQRRGRR